MKIPSSRDLINGLSSKMIFTFNKKMVTIEQVTYWTKYDCPKGFRIRKISLSDDSEIMFKEKL